MPPPTTSASSSRSMASDTRPAPFHGDRDASAGAEGRHPRRVLAWPAGDHDLNAFWSAYPPVVTVGHLDAASCELRPLAGRHGGLGNARELVHPLPDPGDIPPVPGEGGGVVGPEHHQELSPQGEGLRTRGGRRAG